MPASAIATLTRARYRASCRAVVKVTFFSLRASEVATMLYSRGGAQSRAVPSYAQNLPMIVSSGVRVVGVGRRSALPGGLVVPRPGRPPSP